MGSFWAIHNPSTHTTVPATSYIISAQIALIAASAAYVGYDRQPGKTDAADQASKVQQQVRQEPPAPVPAPAGEVTVPQWPAANFPRYAPAEKLAQETTPTSTSARPMGGRTGDATPSRNQSLPTALVHDKSPAAKVSADPADEPPTFAPVPEDQGYHITADSATNFDLNAKTVVFSGHVVVQSSDFVIKTNRLVVYNGTGGSMSKMVANGDVDFHLVGVPADQVYRGQSEEAVFEPGKNLITFMGWPRIQGKGREHRAADASTTMRLFTQPSRLETTGRASTRILPGEGGTAIFTTPAAKSN